MKVIKSDRIAYFDVDDTLVLWEAPENITDENFIEIEYEEHTRRLVPHQKHIQTLKDFKARGQFVCVWSQGGWQWAEKVVRALGLETYVDVVMCKPSWYFDDLSCEEWMGKRYYEQN